MICHACSDAAGEGVYGEEYHLAWGCPGEGFCDCQHKVPLTTGHPSVQDGIESKAESRPEDEPQ